MAEDEKVKVIPAAKPLPTAYGVPVNQLTSKKFTRRQLSAACDNCTNVKKKIARPGESRFVSAFPGSGHCAVIGCPVNQVPPAKRN